MKLFKVTHNLGSRCFDSYDGVIVWAHDEGEALETAIRYMVDNSPVPAGEWAVADSPIVKEQTPPDEPCVIFSAFNAG